MLSTYNFKFRYKSAGLDASGNGSVKAESIEDAIDLAELGVAGDFGTTPDKVAIVSIKKVNAKKRRAVRSHA